MPGPDQGLGAPPRVPFGQALAFWFKLGWISFGGPAGQIALMHQEVVERRGWIDEKRFLHALNFCMLLPGPEAQQLATYIGWMLHRTWGGVVAGVLFVLPSLAILIGLSWLYVAHGDVPQVAALLWGLKPAVVAVVALAVRRMAGRVLQGRLSWAIAAAAFVALAVLNLPFPLVIAVAALVGWWGRQRHSPAPGEPAPGEPAPGEPALGHAARRSALRAAAVCVLLWLSCLAALVAAFGWGGTLSTMAWFFTKAALLTFGGAYAVLPYVVQGAVEQQQWLTATQMLDGLALGETTPGPLIMVVAFVGFLGGWGQALFGPGQELWAGVAGAVVATVFTFLPSFLFILGGAPLVERSHGIEAFTAPLKAISAAVVGVVLNLAVYLGAQVLWPAGGFDAGALLIGLAAAALLWSGRVGVVPVILLAGVAGLIGRMALGGVLPG